MTRYPRVYRKPTVYVVGKDISESHWEQVVVAVTDWFRELYPNEKAPASRARIRLRECLEGTKKDGTPWFQMDTADLASRIRSKCLFDINKMEGMRKITDKKVAAQKKAAEGRKVRKLAGARNKFLPESLKEELRQKAVYGDDPRIFMTTKEEGLWQDYFDSYVEQFPELSTINAQAELQSLCDAHILKARYRMQVLAGEKVNTDQVAAVDKQLVDMKKALGIHPDQLAKRTKPKNELSVAEAVAKLHNMPNWMEVRQRIWDEQLLQIYQMCMTPRASGEGYQLDEVRLYGLTKTKVIKCPNCGVENFDGLPLDAIEEYLQRMGRLEEVEDAEGSGEEAGEPESAFEADSGAESGAGIPDASSDNLSGIS